MGMWSRIKRTFREGSQHRNEIQEELEFHLHMDEAGGRDARQARLRLGNVARVAEETRAMGLIEWLESAMQDARFGWRQLRKTPALVAAVVLSLTIGIGANTAIFSLVDAAILRPLPVRDPDSLRIIEWTSKRFPQSATNHNGEYRPIAGELHQGTSIPAYLHRRLAREQRAFESIIGTGAYPEPVAVASATFPAEQASLQYVSSNFFEGLGVVPMRGRAFREDEDRVGAEPVVVVSHRFWQRRLAGSEAALGRYIRINNVPARIAGVAPVGFFGVRAGQWPDIYAPLAAKVSFLASSNTKGPVGEDDGNWWVRSIGRLRPEVSEAEARSEIASLFRSMVPGGGEADSTIPELVTMPGRRGFNALNPKDANALWILTLLVGMLLLIVCANVANLLLSRSVGRQRESSVRLALGAGRVRLFRQHLIESGLLAVLGGGAGLALGYVLAQSIHLLFQTGKDASNAFDLHIDPRVIGYTAAISIATAVLFGLAPAIRAARTELGVALKAQTRSVIGGGLRLPSLLVSLQIALCLAAMVSAGLLGRSLENLKWTDVGFERENLAYATISPSRAGYTPERLGAYVARVREELARLPGVIRVSPVQTRPLSGGGNNGRVNLPGQPWGDAARTNLNNVGDGFFETIGMPVIAGRALEARDMREEADAVVVDEIFARRHFPNENPLGRRFGLTQESNSRYQIVGIVGNSLYNRMRGDVYPTVYLPYRAGGTVHFALRTTLDAERLVGAVRTAIAAVDASVPLTEFHTQTGLIDRTLRTERLLSFVSGAFGVVALALAAIGLGGLLAYAVARRTNEIGVRMALGAATGDVIRLVLRDSMWMLLAGVLMGLPCAWAVGTFLKSALYRLEPMELQTVALACTVLMAVALMAALLPARRAVRIDPMSALREE